MRALGLAVVVPAALGFQPGILPVRCPRDWPGELEAARSWSNHGTALCAARWRAEGQPSRRARKRPRAAAQETLEADDQAETRAVAVASIPEPPAPSSLMAKEAALPFLLLNAVTVLWGTQHAVIKLILQDDLSPGVTNFARFALAAVAFSPWTPGLPGEPMALPFSPGEEEPTSGEGATATASTADVWAAGTELGAWMFLGFAFQAVGLGFTTASRSAFLLYLNVKLVPLFAFVLLGRSISAPTLISAVLAFTGTVLLSWDGSPPNVGDLWSVAAAAASAMFILRLERYSGRCPASQLNSANLWVTAGLCGLWAVWEVAGPGGGGGRGGGVDFVTAVEGVGRRWPLIAYLALVTTALTNWLQALGQRSVPAERAAIIYAMDPVYAAGFAYALLGESLGPQGLGGAALVTGAAIWSQQQATADASITSSSEDGH